VHDDDTMGGATPSHQAKTQAIDANIWGDEMGSGEEITLPMPPCMEDETS